MGQAPQRLNDEQKAAWNEAYGPKKEAYEREKPEGDDLVRWKYKRYMEDYLGCIAAVDENTGPYRAGSQGDGAKHKTRNNRC